MQTTVRLEGMSLLDEISRAAPAAANIFLPTLDSRRTLFVEDAINEDDREIKLHDKRVLWATANIGAEFVGTNNLDHALLNRFQQVGVHYPPVTKESLLLQKGFDLDKFTSDKLVAVADAIRKNTDLSKDISTRQLFDIAELISDGFSVKKAFDWTVMQQFDNAEGEGGERQTVASILSQYA